MFRFFRKHRSFVMVFLAACIVGLILFGIGGTSLVSTPQDTIMKINGRKVTQMEFDRIYNQLLRQKQGTTTPEQRQQVQSQALNELIREEVFFQESKKYGIRVPDQELQMQLASIPAFQKDGHFDAATYVRTVTQAFQMSPHEFEKTHKKDIASRQLNQLIASTVNISDDQLKQELEAHLKTETDLKKRKELTEDPEKFRQELQEKEVNLVFADWLNQLNSTLKVNMVSETFRKRLGAPAQ
jgi:predicted thioredoxin/glutaredoxin